MQHCGEAKSVAVRRAFLGHDFKRPEALDDDIAHFAARRPDAFDRGYRIHPRETSRSIRAMSSRQGTSMLPIMQLAAFTRR